jgi:hypothetical protein
MSVALLHNGAAEKQKEELGTFVVASYKLVTPPGFESAAISEPVEQ